MAAEPGWAARWDEAYAQGDTRCSWFQDAPEMSLRMLVAQDREEHTTPSGPAQPFTRVALRRTR
jgi:hypothetical protein